MSSIKYIAFLDILGFKELIENNKLQEIEELYDSLQKSLLFTFAYSNPKHMGAKKLPTIVETVLNSLVISDSIIIWTDDDDQGSFMELLFAVKYFMYFSMKSGFPLRGGISSGELVVKSGKHDKSPKFNSYTTLLGLSLTRAYIMESKSEWSGCIIDELSVRHFNKKLKGYESNVADLDFFEKMDVIHSYEVPMKSGPVKKYYAVNWTHFNGPRLTPNEVKKGFKAHNKNVTDWAVQNKIRNTLKFLADTKKGYKKIHYISCRTKKRHITTYIIHC